MRPRDRLRRLGQLYGIEPSYLDVYGRRRRLSEPTARALLAAMGAAVGSEAEIADSLREAEARPWRRMLAPVYVLARPEPLEITFTLADPRGGLARWRVVEETGAVHEGEVRLDDLPTAAEAEVNGERYRRRRLRLPAALGDGYHRLQLAVSGRGGADAEGKCRLVVAPATCFLPEHETDGGRLWGVACQLYGVRSERNWGMGDFSDLARLAEKAAALGAGALGVNPLHALFPADANHISPYSPSSRSFVNVLYLDPEAVPDLGECAAARALLGRPGFRDEVATARAAEYVDYPAVWRLKLPVLERLFASFRERHRDDPASERGRAFRAFRAEMGEDLEHHALFDALHEHVIETTGAWAWQHWPEAYRRPDGPAVEAFAAKHRDRVDFFCWLQWLADAQLKDAQARARAAGMPIGLYQDIAVAVNPASSMAWANP
ncbi:MAG: 4-alpha-glucanotransferase, partial [Geminicoccaceae bacterium]